MRGGIPAFLLAGARCLRAALSGEAARRQRDGQRAGQRAVTRSPVTRAARGQRDGQRESSAKRKTGSGQSSALQPIKSPECRHASAQKTRSNYSAKGSSEPLPFLVWKKCKSSTEVVMTEKSYGTTRYTTAGCDAGNDVRDARGSSTRVMKRLHR